MLNKKQWLQELEELNIVTCEVKLEDCTNYMYLTPAHRHKRRFYKTQPWLLWHMNQVILACQNCHHKIEYYKSLSEEVFDELRGEDLLKK